MASERKPERGVGAGKRWFDDLRGLTKGFLGFVSCERADERHGNFGEIFSEAR